MSRRFHYYNDWQNAILYCRKCGWSGRFWDGSVEYYDELMDCSCPRCKFPDIPILAIVSYPTIREMLASGNPADVQEAKNIIGRAKAFDRVKLSSPAQLPDISDSAPFSLIWDVQSGAGGGETLIRFGDAILFREPVRWQAIDSRYEEVCKILKERYGERVRDLAPTPQSEMYLYGDRGSGPATGESIRRRIFGGNTKALASA